MAEQLERLARPSSVLESPGIRPASGVNRGHLTLYLSIAAIILSVASAGVYLFKYLNGERAKMAAETELAKIMKTKEEALARAAQLEVALKTQQIRTSAAQEQEALAAKTNHLASARNNDQDTAKKRGETQTADAQGYLNHEVILKSGIVPLLVRSVQGSVTGDENLLAVPRRSSIGPSPIATGVSRSRGGDVIPFQPWDEPLSHPRSGWGTKESTSK